MRDEISLCIVGWYGTETLGDRAILDGIIRIYKQIYKNVVISLGSLYPFYSKRTLYEEKDIYEADIEVFDVKNAEELRNRVKNSDCVIMGGGPIMDIKELYVVYRAFKYGKRYGKRNILMGCGLGPISLDTYINLTYDVLKLSDLIIYRDDISLEYSEQLFGKLKNTVVCDDPAIISICRYREEMKTSSNDTVSLNLRRYPNIYGEKKWLEEKTIATLIDKLRKAYEKVYLVPMHTFFIGGDDREYLQEMLSTCHVHDNVVVIDHGLNLNTLYRTFMNSSACIGMRYHSVVMQTILNGNNYILNYTDKKNGKIEGFLKGLGNEAFYKERIYTGTQDEELDTDKIINILSKNQKYPYEFQYKELINQYSAVLK